MADFTSFHLGAAYLADRSLHYYGMVVIILAWDLGSVVCNQCMLGPISNKEPEKGKRTYKIPISQQVSQKDS